MEKKQYVSTDVFLFESDGSCLSDLICALIGAPVSHAALYYKEGRIIEEVLSGIQASQLVDDLKKGDRVIHVMRYLRATDEINDALLAVEAEHEKNKDPYSIGNLVMMGILLLSKLKWQEMTEDVLALLTRICIRIANRIDKKVHPGTQPMTCAQFVYDCYQEAGHRLRIKQPEKTAERQTAADATLMDMMLMRGANAEDEKQLTLPLVDEGDKIEDADSDESADIFEKLCCAVLKWVQKHQVSAFESADFHPAEEADLLLRQARVFAVLVLRISDNTGYRTVLRPGELKRAIENLRVVYDGFVTPGDLLYNCPDLIKKEVING